MKTAFLIFLLILSRFPAYSQALAIPFDSLTHKISYNEVIKSPGLSQDQLYVKAREWFAKAFNSAQAVIQMDDKQAAKIVGKATVRSSYIFLLTVFNYTLYYTISFSAKEGRYRYEITDFLVKDDDSPSIRSVDECVQSKECRNKKGNYKEPYKSYMAAINQMGTGLSENLKTALRQGTAKSANSNDDF